MRYTAVTHIPSIAIKQGVVPEGAQITIAIPTYKRAHLLRETLESCLAQQTNCPFAIMVVDNNPERECETEQLLREYKAIPNLFYYKNTENVGMTGNWNKLFELSQTDFVVMLHDDDLLYDDYVEKVECILKKYNYDINALYLPQQMFSTKENIPHRKEQEFYSVKLKLQDLFLGNICNLVGACFKKEVIIEQDGFDQNYYPSLDYEMHFRLIQKEKSFIILGSPLTLYRILENESMKPNTLLNFLFQDERIIQANNRKYFFYKVLFPFFYKEYALQAMISHQKTYHHKDFEREIKKERVRVINKVVYKILLFFRKKVFNYRRKKI